MSIGVWTKKRVAFDPDVAHESVASDLGAPVYYRDVVGPVMRMLSKQKEPGHLGL